MLAGACPCFGEHGLRSAPLCPSHPQERLRAPVSSSSQFTVLTKPDQILVVDEEVLALLGKHAIRRVSRLGIVNVRCSKVGGGLATHHQLEVAQQDFSQRSPLPDERGPRRGGPSSPRRLGSVDLSQGRLLPRPHQSPLPSLELERPSLRVHGSPVRPLPSPTHAVDGVSA